MRAFQTFLFLAFLGAALLLIAAPSDPAAAFGPETLSAGRALPLFPPRPISPPTPTPTPSAIAAPAEKSWHYVARLRISSAFGWRRHPIYGDVRRHPGVDLPKPFGTLVFPAEPGTVSYAGWRSGYGWVVELKHKDGTKTLYGHLSKIFVASGQRVTKGILLGAVGSSGLSTGPHLHFEYRNAAGQPVDPGRFLRTVL
jgi:murein DD-endopeptidase MepM/ murein hydrolase activator NlpD